MLAHRSWVHMAGGAVLMGSWAGYANRAFAMPAPVLAALVQGALTATITLFMKRLIEAVAARFTGPAGYILPVAAAGAMSLCLLGSIHWLAGTPAILATIAVPFCVASSYAALYTISLKRLP